MSVVSLGMVYLVKRYPYPTFLDEQSPPDLVLNKV